MENTFWEKFVQDYTDAQMTVIGIGAQFQKSQFESDEKLSEIIDFYSSYLEKKITL